MKRHVTIAAFVLALAGYSLGHETHRDSQDAQNQAEMTHADAKLSKKDRKKLEKEDNRARKQERKEEKHLEKKQVEEQRKQYKEQEKQADKERRREQKEQEKQVASEQKKDEKYERKQAERAEKQEARDMNRHIEREAHAERASAVHIPAPRYVYVPRIPVSSTATPGLLLAQRNVSHAIYSQLPSSDVRVLLDSGNRIVLRGSAPSPSWRQRLLQLAMGAASGYSVVDQLASNLVGDAASAATSAAIGGVSDLIHGSRAKDNVPETAYAPPPDSVPQAPAYPQQALPNSDAEAMNSVLDPGSNACVNLSSSSQILLTGQVASQPSADLIRRFAHQLASSSAVVTDQLAVRTTGVPAAANVSVPSAATAAQDVASTSGAGITADASSPATMVSPGSTVCVTENHGEIFLTGTVGSTAELGTVENAVQPLVGNGRLLDNLTIAGMNSGTQIATSTPAGNVGSTPPTQQSEVEQALHSIPRLSNVNVQVMGDGVHLSGSVDTMQDDQMAADVARQYAPGRPVLDNLAVANRTQAPRQ
ncbi:MAG TPA: BON domain-containing protein [Terriglobales bacterium]|nr:BON domain-containing protein [Terriglobales bacterium]